MERADGSAILLTDTVGFIRRLPHDLVNAFRSTLEEATLADLVLIVLDASDPEVIEQHRTTIQVLDELGAGDKPRLIVLNKIDRVDHPDIFEGLAFRFKDAIRISARTGDGLEELSQRIDSILGGSVSTLSFPADRHDLAALVHRTGSAVEEEYTDDAIRMRARLPERVRGQLREWLEEE
jgi:GTP-binding protein HflX